MTETNRAPWKAVTRDAESEQFSRFGREVNQYQEAFARRSDGEARRAFHVKLHAGVSAEFAVSGDIPESAKHGVFKEARRFLAWARISNGFSAPRPDWFPDLVGLAVKLTGVEGKKVLEGEENAQTQDFLALNQPFVPAYNTEQFVLISLSSANLLSAPLKLVRGLGLGHAAFVLLWIFRWTLRRMGMKSVTTEDFSSCVPIALGPHAMKFRWQSRQKASRAARAPWWQRNYLRQDLKDRLKDADITFDFMAQLYVDAEKTPIEGGFEWKESDAPFLKLAELTIRRRDLDTTEARREERYVDTLSFNPWHALSAHRPIGNVQRGRGVIYRAGALYRGRAADPIA